MFHFFHRWTKWVILETGSLVKGATPDKIHVRGTYAIRYRHCLQCDKEQKQIQHCFKSSCVSHVPDDRVDQSINPQKGFYFDYEDNQEGLI